MRAKVFILVLLAALSVPFAVAAKDDAPPEVKKAAKEGMKNFLKAERIKSLSGHGFANTEELEKAELGEGFELFTLPLDKILDDATTNDVLSLVKSTNQWSFFILLNDEAKTMITVDFIDGKWMPVELGSSGFAKIMFSFFKVWPASSGYQFKYVKIYQPTASFIEVFQHDKLIGIVPGTRIMGLIEGKAPKEYDPSHIVNPNEVINAIRQLH